MISIQKQIHFNVCLLLFALVFFSTSCNKEKQICVDDFTGTYRVEENCGGSRDDYDIKITKFPELENTVYITNIFDYESGVEARIGDCKSGMLDIPLQIFYEDEYEVEYIFGSGILKDGILSIDFVIEYEDYETEACSAICVKR